MRERGRERGSQGLGGRGKCWVYRKGQVSQTCPPKPNLYLGALSLSLSLSLLEMGLIKASRGLDEALKGLSSS